MEIWKYGYGNMEILKYGNMKIWKYRSMEIFPQDTLILRSLLSTILPFFSCSYFLAS